MRLYVNVRLSRREIYSRYERDPGRERLLPGNLGTDADRLLLAERRTSGMAAIADGYADKRPPCWLKSRHRVAFAKRHPAQEVADSRAAQDPGRKSIAVRPRPREVALAVRIVAYVLQHRPDGGRLGSHPLRGDARRSAAHASIRRPEIAVHVA